MQARHGEYWHATILPILMEQLFGVISLDRISSQIGVAGWGGLGLVDEAEIPEGVYVLQQRYVPHDWLFRQCAAVVHHGGAGDLPSSPVD